jgi:hypothetical protein
MRALHVGLRVSDKRRPLRFYRIELVQRLATPTASLRSATPEQLDAARPDPAVIAGSMPALAGHVVTASASSDRRTQS